MELAGVLLVDKPVGPTSFDVVRRVRRLLKVKKAGHTGTLDPNASGLLPVCVGDATKIASFLTEGDKEYEAFVRFGTATDTLDALGRVVETRDASHVTRESLEAACAAMLGAQLQVPPMYSAVRVDGRRLYELAREGEEVEREAREIVIDEATVLSFESPDATIRVRCSKGTYVRTIADSLGRALGTVAHLAALRRTASGTLHVRDATPLEELERLAETGRREILSSKILSIEQSLVGLPELRLDARHATSVGFGNPVDLEMQRRLHLPPQPRGRRIRLTGPDDLVVAIGEADATGVVRLLRVLRPQTGPGQKGRA